MDQEKQWGQVKAKQKIRVFQVVHLLKYTTLYIKIYFPQT